MPEISAGCPVLSKCEFFNDVCENMPSSSSFMKERFCLKEHRNCARYLFFVATGGKPPQGLFPDDLENVEKFVTRFKEYGY